MIRRKGFTLIELLIVIAIIAILAAILFPVFASARDKARQTACLANMKEIGLAMQQYTQDYDELFPYGNGLSGGWAEPLYPYVKSTAVYACPNDTTKATGSNVVVSYGASDAVMPDGHYYMYGNTYAALAIAKLTAPSSSIFLFELQGFTENVTNASGTSSPTGTDDDQWFYSGHPSCGNNCVYATGAVAGWKNTYQIGGLAGTDGRHLGGSNYLACDCHAKWALPSRISGGKNAFGVNVAQCSCHAGQACASGTGVMDNGGGTGSAMLTFSVL